LDLRDRDDYDNYHVREAISFPGPNISRDKFPQEIYSFVKYKFKNKYILK
jgi:hypothetical protein